MKVTLILKKSVTRYDTESQATIYARLRDGRQLDLVAPTPSYDQSESLG